MTSPVTFSLEIGRMADALCAAAPLPVFTQHVSFQVDIGVFSDI